MVCGTHLYFYIEMYFELKVAERFVVLKFALSCFHRWPERKGSMFDFLIFSSRVVQDFLVKVVQGEVKDHPGTQDMLGLKGKKATPV